MGWAMKIELGLEGEFQAVITAQVLEDPGVIQERGQSVAVSEGRNHSVDSLQHRHSESQLSLHSTASPK